MHKEYKIFVINPGSTSTKVAYFNNLDCISSKTLRHDPEELSSYSTVAEQYPLRKQAILQYFAEQNISYEDIDAVVGRGGLLKPLKGGTYKINMQMIEDLNSSKYGQHASNLGAIIANEIAELANASAFIVNPVVVDEFDPISRYSGLPEIPRKSVFHALNQKAIAMKAADEIGIKYNEANLIVAHLGGGITVGAHYRGRVIDVNNGLEEGPFSPERSCSLPTKQLVDMCFSGKYTKEEIDKKLVGKGGLVAYLGTSDCKEIGSKAENGDKEAALAFEAMAYQISKEIGAYSTVLFGKVDCIAITGGLAYSDMLVNWISERVKFIAPVKIYPGEDEMSAMAEGACRILNDEEQVLTYE